MSHYHSLPLIHEDGLGLEDAIEEFKIKVYVNKLPSLFRAHNGSSISHFQKLYNYII